MTIHHFDVSDRAAIDEVVALDSACTPSLRDDRDLLELDSAFRPAGVLRGVLNAGRAGAIVHIDADSHEASIGWFSAIDDDSGVAVLHAACEVAFAAGATRVVGPKNISTWRRYRCVIDDDVGGADAAAPFLLEPVTPARIHHCLQRAGFAVERRYATVRIPHVEVGLSTLAMKKACAAGVRFVALEDRSDDDFVDILHGLADAAFAKKSGYRAASREHVAFLYGASRAQLLPGFSFLAEDASGAPLGFVIAWPNLVDDSGATTVIKTLGVSPTAPSFLGWALMHRHVVEARARGFSHGLYALMEKAGPLLRYARDPGRMGGEVGTVFRHYALFSRTAP